MKNSHIPETHYDLDYLLYLCRQFCYSTKIVFPKTSFRSYKVRHALPHAQYNVDFKSTSDVSLEKTFYAHDICRRFIDKLWQRGTRAPSGTSTNPLQSTAN